jgi:hypothetical protein
MSATEVGVFTALSTGPKTSEQLTKDLELHPRGAGTLFDTLVGLGLLERTGDDLYGNTPETNTFLVKGRDTYVGGLLDLMGGSMWQSWSRVTDMLRTGQAQYAPAGADDGNIFDMLYADPDSVKAFLSAMSGNSAGPVRALVSAFPWDRHGSVMDIGTAQGLLPVELARAHPHLVVGGFDLPPIGPVFDSYVAEHGLSDRITFWPGDFFEDELPAADVLVFGNVLHNWSLAERNLLLRKAYDALPTGGALIVYETVIDDDRRVNTFAMLMSLSMMVSTSEGSDSTGAEFRERLRNAGFSDVSVTPLSGPYSMVVAVK